MLMRPHRMAITDPLKATGRDDTDLDQKCQEVSRSAKGDMTDPTSAITLLVLATHGTRNPYFSGSFFFRVFFFPLLLLLLLFASAFAFCFCFCVCFCFCFCFLLLLLHLLLLFAFAFCFSFRFCFLLLPLLLLLLLLTIFFALTLPQSWMIRPSP